MVGCTPPLRGSVPAGGQGETEGLNVVSLFAGIGGFELGLERAGMTVVAQCEINPVCRHLLAHHWPDVQQFDDVCTMRAADVPHRVHVLCGGFPCQDISFAGKGAGLAGERSGLWREYARLVREFRPRFVIVENVAALLGRGLGDVLGDLAALGYDAWWDCIPASAVGAPHRRDRLWVVAYARGEQHEGYGDALRREIAAGLSRAHPDADCEPVQWFAGVVFAPERAPPGRGGDGLGCVGEGEPTAGDLGNADGSPADPFTPAGRSWRAAREPGWWLSEPPVGRVAHGVPARVDRLHGLGNAVVPQIPEILGRAIIAAMPASQRIAA